MEQNQKQKKKLNLASYAIVVGFLCLEVLALVSFNLGHNYILYGSLFIALAILLFIVTFHQIKKDGIATFGYFVFPIFIFGLISALSPFVKQSDGTIGIANAVFIPLALTFVALCGYFTGHIAKFDMQKVFLVIYAALAVFVLINFIATMIYYVPFYTLIYKNSYIFFDGKPSSVPIGETAYMLFGFQITEVSITYWSLYPSILLSSVIALSFIKFKTNRKLFFTYLAFAILGGICLIFTFSRKTLLGDLMTIFVIVLIIVIMKFKKSHKVLKTVGIVLLVLFLLGNIVLFLNAQTNWGFLHSLQSAIKGNSFTNRLFNSNRYVSLINPILWELFNPGKLFGSFVGYVYEGDGLHQQLAGYWPYDNLLTSGVFGSIFFAFAIFVGFRRINKFVKNSKELDINKWLLVAYVTMTFGVTLVAFDGTPMINANNLFPFYMFTPLLIAIFLMSYTFKPLEKTEEKEKNSEIKEEIEDEKTINI